MRERGEKGGWKGRGSMKERHGRSRGDVGGNLGGEREGKWEGKKGREKK